MSEKEKDVMNFSHIQIFTFFNYTIFTISTIILSFFAYLILISTTNQMKVYRILMFTFLFCLFLVQLIFFLWQIIRLFTFDILVSSGPLIFGSSKLFSFAACLYVIVLPLFADTLELSFLERHFIIFKVLFPKLAKMQRKLLYFSMFFTYIFAVGFNITFFVNCVDDEKALKILNSKFSNFLPYFGGQQPAILIFDNVNNLLGIIFAAIYGFFRLFIALWILYQNFMYSKNPNYAKSENSRQQFKFMFQTTIIQLLTFIAFAIPCSIFVGLAIFPANWIIKMNEWFFVKANLPLIYLIVFGIIMLYPATFCLLAIIYIKTYRNAAIKIFRKPKIMSMSFFSN